MKKRIGFIIVFTLILMTGCKNGIDKEIVVNEELENNEIVEENEVIENSEIVEENEIVEDNVIVESKNVYDELKQTADEYGLKYFEYTEGTQEIEKYNLIFVSEYCEACNHFLPTVMQYINSDKHIPTYLVDMGKEGGYELSNKLNIEYTPTTLVMNNEKEVNRIIGNVTIEELEQGIYKGND